MYIKSTFNAENFICRSSWAIFSDFGAIHSWNVCRSLKSQKNITKIFYFPYQGRSKSFKVIGVGTAGKIVSMLVMVIATVLTIDVLIAQNLRFRRGYPYLTPSFKGNVFFHRHKIWSQETKDSTLSCGENSESLSHLGLSRYRDVTPGQTGGQTELR